MLRVTIELLPGGDEKHARTIGTAEIQHTGYGETEGIADYGIRLFHLGEFWNEGIVEGFRRKLTVWDLLHVALENIVGDRNREGGGE